ncbi:hypothetical protein DU502_17245 [Haloplanus aerogenes]|uniref:Uncharacterized protein n=1 Tax=Haloplanus aerogenes TaxID=660522 RepID=A0A3G8R1W3_9EURY|nr:hypothetical protein DU502_17245 [Haloplanus aerogenes]
MSRGARWRGEISDATEASPTEAPPPPARSPPASPAPVPPRRDTSTPRAGCGRRSRRRRLSIVARRCGRSAPTRR